MGTVYLPVVILKKQQSFTENTANSFRYSFPCKSTFYQYAQIQQHEQKAALAITFFCSRFVVYSP